MRLVRNNQKGFAHLGMLLAVLLVLAAIGGTGYYVFQKNHSKVANSANSQPDSDNGKLTYINQSTVTKAKQAISSATSISKLEDALNKEFLEKEYACDNCTSLAGSGVAFITSDSSYVINGKDILNDLPQTKFQYLSEADLPAAKQFAGLFVEEISKYPTEIGKSLPFFGFAFIKNLNVSGDAAGGVTSYLIYYDVSQMRDAAYSREAINHEFAHMLDEYGLLSVNKGDINSDPQWTALNGSQSIYTDNYAKALNMQTNTEHPQAGFVTQYAMTNIAEDKAETWAYILGRKSAAKLAQWEKTDTILKNKVNYLLNGIDKTAPGFKAKLPAQVSLYGE